MRPLTVYRESLALVAQLRSPEPGRPVAYRPSLTSSGRRPLGLGRAQHAVDVVGHLDVFQRKGVGVVAQRG
jgi:hypothetical protein